MIQQPSVAVKKFPDCLNIGACRAFLRNLQVFLSQSYRPQIIFDLSAVPHMNAAGIDLLLQCVVEVANRDGTLKLAAPAPQTALVLELTQLNDVVEIFNTEEEALASFGVHQILQPLPPEPLPHAA
ncbi:MAG TPA: STAS domain-containing protein [Terriglobales bacterium]|nr:STAS domain-containing protein [Terriglobales bacterium]